MPWLILKRIALGLMLVVELPLIVATWIESAVWGRRHERVFGGCKELLALVPTVVGQYVRAAYYWACCANVSPDLCMALGSMIAHRETAIGRRVVIGSYSVIGLAEVGDDVMIGSRVSVVSGKYQHGRPRDRAAVNPSSGRFHTVRIGRNSWVGEGAVILADVGENCTIAAGAVLYRDAPDNATLVGNPARRVDFAPKEGLTTPPTSTPPTPAGSS